MASAEELRQQLAASRAAFREAMAATGSKWEEAPADDEWAPRKIVEHAIGTDVVLSTRSFEALQSKPSDWQDQPLASLDAALAQFDSASAISDRAFRYVEDHDLTKAGNPVGGSYSKNVEGILQNAINHLTEHTETLKKRA